jgi:RNA polymerase sigma factor (sigma-70 family)
MEEKIFESLLEERVKDGNYLGREVYINLQEDIDRLINLDCYYHLKELTFMELINHFVDTDGSRPEYFFAAYYRYPKDDYTLSWSFKGYVNNMINEKLIYADRRDSLIVPRQRRLDLFADIEVQVLEDLITKLLKNYDENKANSIAKCISYIKKIVNSSINDFFRKREKNFEYMKGVLGSGVISVENNPERLNIIRDKTRIEDNYIFKEVIKPTIKKSLSELSNYQNEVVKLSFYDNYGPTKIGKLLGGKDRRNIHRTLNMALNNLRKNKEINDLQIM